MGYTFNQKVLLKYATPVACIVLFIGLAIGFRHPIANQLNEWKLLPEPERLTELYFTKPNSLPSTYTPGQAQTVSFTVHNLEYRNTDYPYVISETDESTNRSTVLSTGSFSLGMNQYRSLQVPITINLDDKTVLVSISLTNVNENINYYVGRG